MRNIFSVALAVILASVLAAPAFAGDGHVPKSTLDRLGLAGMQPVSDAEGMQVRGMSGCARVLGRSLVSGLLLDPVTTSYVFGADSNSATSSAENGGCRVKAQATHQQLSNVSLSLTVSIDNGLSSVFDGYLIGGAGGSGMAWAK